MDEFAEVQLGRQRSPKNHTGPSMHKYLRAANVTWKGLNLDDVMEMNFNSDELERFRLQVDDLLLAEGSGSPDEVGKPAMFRGEINDCCFQNTLIRVRPGHLVLPKYLLHLFGYEAQAGHFGLASRGVNIHHLGSRTLAAWPVAVPPRDEQLRIVELIEKQFSRLDAGVEPLQRAKRNLARLRLSILQAGVEGRLTASNAASWDTKSIGQLAHVGSGATPKRGNQEYWVGGAIPWVTSGQLNDSLVTEPADYITERALEETSVRLWPAGTILVAMYGEGRTRGKCSELAFPSTTNQACAAIVLDEEFEHIRPFLKLFLNSRYEQTRRLASGGVQPNLSLGLTKSIEVPIPPAADQVRIVAEVERQLSIMDALERALDSACIRAAGLRRSTLRDAFSGRLVSRHALLEVADA